MTRAGESASPGVGGMVRVPLAIRPRAGSLLCIWLWSMTVRLRSVADMPNVSGAAFP
jgi:hypothetical protein